jgi:hypothetical protein
MDRARHRPYCGVKLPRSGAKGRTNMTTHTAIKLAAQNLEPKAFAPYGEIIERALAGVDVPYNARNPEPQAASTGNFATRCGSYVLAHRAVGLIDHECTTSEG